MRLEALHANMSPPLRTNVFAIAELGEGITDLFALARRCVVAVVLAMTLVVLALYLSFACTFSGSALATVLHLLRPTVAEQRRTPRPTPRAVYG